MTGQPLLADVQALQAIAHLLSGQRLLTMHLLGGADRLGHDHGVDEAAVVEDLANVLALAGPQALVIDILEDVVEHWIGGARSVEGRALVALGRGPRRLNVGLRPGPPDADEPVHRIADPGWRPILSQVDFCSRPGWATGNRVSS